MLVITVSYYYHYGYIIITSLSLLLLLSLIIFLLLLLLLLVVVVVVPVPSAKAKLPPAGARRISPKADLRTKILNFRGLLQQNLDFKGWNSRVHREFPGKLESTNLSRDTRSREIGRRVSPRLASPSEQESRRAIRVAIFWTRHRLNAYLAQRVPIYFLFIASSSRTCLDYAVLTCMFHWRTH